MRKPAKLFTWLFFLVLSPLRVFASPASWEKILSAEPLERHPSVNQAYEKHRTAYLAKKKTAEAVIFEDVFGLDEQQARQCSENGCELRYRLTINRFPYGLEDDIAHLLLFSSQSVWDEAVLKQKSEELLRQHLPDNTQYRGIEWSIRINPPWKRTVKGLGHAHIFIRDTEGTANLIQWVDQLKQQRQWSIDKPVSD